MIFEYFLLLNTFLLENNMKICYFIDTDLIQVRNWVNYFVNRGHNLSIISREFLEYSNAKVYPISKYFNKVSDRRIISFALHNLYNIKRYILLNKLIRRLNPEIYHSHYLTNSGILSSSLNLHPLIITCMGSDILIAPKKFGKKHVRNMKIALNKADIIHSVSEQITNEIKKFGIDENKIITIPRGANLNLFNSRKNKKRKYT